MELKKEFNTVLIEKVFTTHPFNLDLPQDSANNALKLTQTTLLELIIDNSSWFTVNSSFLVSSKTY
jgi:hypothetical protein